MTRSLCGAFASRALSQEVRVLGLAGDYARTHLCRPSRATEGGMPCTLCKEMCITFPPSYVRRLYRREDTRLDKLGDMSDICMTPRDFMAALRARPDGEAFLRNEGIFMLLHIIGNELRSFDLDRNDSMEGKTIQRLEEGKANDPTEIIFFSDSTFASLKFILENVIGPKTLLTKEDMYACMEIVCPRAIFKTTLDQLCNLGLPIDKSDFFIIDEYDVR
jgi:hypothetical protein